MSNNNRLRGMPPEQHRPTLIRAVPPHMLPGSMVNGSVCLPMGFVPYNPGLRAPPPTRPLFPHSGPINAGVMGPSMAMAAPISAAPMDLRNTGTLANPINKVQNEAAGSSPRVSTEQTADQPLDLSNKAKPYGSPKQHVSTILMYNPYSCLSSLEQ